MGRQDIGRLLKLLVLSSVPLLLWLIPVTALGIDGLTITQQRMLAVLALAVLFWIFEPIPIFATSILIIGAELFLISTKGLTWLVKEPGIGTLMPFQDIMATFASPIILLFLGGFFLAIAASKYRLDRNLARVLLKPFGESPRFLMLGLMVITAIFSMFMSNTATTAMMLAILAPVISLFPQGDPARQGFLLSVPLAANIGGLGTPIGTPPNAVALKYLTGENSISFAQWMAFGVPLALVLLAFAWYLVLALYPPREKAVKLTIEGRFATGFRPYTVYVTFVLTILLWLTGHWHGMNSYVVAMVPVTIFVATGIMTKDDLKKINWDVLWLISGGIALGYGLETTGLSQTLIQAVPFDSLGALGILGLFTIMALVMASLMSNTATANLLLPIVAALAVNLPDLIDLGGLKISVLLVALTCSMGMALPISTPPNALAYATGQIESKDLMKAGGITSLVGLVLIYILGYILNL
jgi:sodium-dependent dicarboxylate transporter 2/3/5